jgi:hypothetical protein
LMCIAVWPDEKTCVLAFQRAYFYANRCSGSVFSWVPVVDDGIS